MSKKITEDLKQEMIDFYLSKPMSLKSVEDKYQISHPTISKIFKDVPKYSKAQINNPHMNERFFEKIDSERKAYFLGLMIADGNVFKDNTGRQSSISITLKLEDQYILQEFKNSVGSNTSIGKDGRGCGQIAVRSNLMAKDLEQYGIIPRKSNKTYLPNIDNNYMSHLIRGIFDGDGSILAKPSPRNDGHNRFLHSFSFCGTKQLMNDISNFIYTTLKLNQKPTVYDYKDRQLSELKIQNIKDMDIFGTWMYKESTVFLLRKKEIFDNFKNHYNLN